MCFLVCSLLWSVKTVWVAWMKCTWLTKQLEYGFIFAAQIQLFAFQLKRGEVKWGQHIATVESSHWFNICSEWQRTGWTENQLNSKAVRRDRIVHREFISLSLQSRNNWIPLLVLFLCCFSFCSQTAGLFWLRTKQLAPMSCCIMFAPVNPNLGQLLLSHCKCKYREMDPQKKQIKRIKQKTAVVLTWT